MRDLSMHVLDIVQNSIRAEATLVEVSFLFDSKRVLTFSVKDDGCGMSEALLKKVIDPFTTTRTTRKVGLGIPMLKQSAEMCGGSFHLESKEGEGTIISASFDTENVDCIPMGAMCDSLLSLVVLNPFTPEFVFYASNGDSEALFDTRKLRQILGDVPLSDPDVVTWMKESIEEEFRPILEVF